MKTIFWNVDTQYDFMRNDEVHKGKLAIPGAAEIEVNLAYLTGFAKQMGVKVVNTADWHTPDSAEFAATPDYVNTFPPHCLAGTKGAAFVPATAPEHPVRVYWKEPAFNGKAVLRGRNIVLYKDKFDVFTGTPHADPVLKLLRPERAIVYGVATNVCVDFAVRGLLERKVEVYVPTDAIKELPNMPLPYGKWEELGAKLITTKEVPRYLV